MLPRQRGTAPHRPQASDDVVHASGGKIEPREAPDVAARREVEEELGITLDVGDLSVLGSWSAPAANEPGLAVRATVFVARDRLEPRDPVAAAEIAELRWVHPLGVPHDPVFAPLLRQHVVPALAAARRT